VAITHTKVSALADDADTSLVRPSDWNAEHVVADGSLSIAKTTGLQAALDAAAAPAGSDTQIQYNNAGALGASAAVTFEVEDDDWGSTQLRVYQNNGLNSAVVRAVADDFEAWTAVEAYNTWTDVVAGLQRYGGCGGLWLGRGRGSNAARSDVLVGDALGVIKFAGICQSGARFDAPGHIGCEVKEVGTYIGANLVFGTKSMAAADPIYRMRLDADGGLVLRASSTVDPTGASKGAGTINATGLYVSGVPVNIPATTVGALPSAATSGAGARSFVTDATATTFLSTAAGGGANKVPVVSDGTNWLIG
jgi:hypothetical protein